MTSYCSDRSLLVHSFLHKTGEVMERRCCFFSESLNLPEMKRHSHSSNGTAANTNLCETPNYTQQIKRNSFFSKHKNK